MRAREDEDFFLKEEKTKKEVTNDQHSQRANPYDAKHCTVPEWNKPEGWAGTATRETADRHLATAFASLSRRPPKRKRRGNGDE